VLFTVSIRNRLLIRQRRSAFAASRRSARHELPTNSFFISRRGETFGSRTLSEILVMDREEASKLAESALSDLAGELKAGKSDTLVRYLNMLSQFHQYSFGNCILIAMQRPNASMVAGFQRWKQLGRFVKKGEKGIAILAPLVYRRKSDDDEKQADKSDDEPKARVLGFKVVHIFDVSQTEGAELPEFSRIDGDPGEYVEKMRTLITAQQIALSYEDLPEGNDGVSQGGSIVIANGLEPANHFAVLVHELAHELLHRGEPSDASSRLPRGSKHVAWGLVSWSSSLAPFGRST
jgi:hypothetical protein